MAANVMGADLMQDIQCDQHEESNQVYYIILLELGVQELLPLQCCILTWGWRYKVGPRDPKVGQITIHGHHCKCAKFHNFPMFRS